MLKADDQIDCYFYQSAQICDNFDIMKIQTSFNFCCLCSGVDGFGAFTPAILGRRKVLEETKLLSAAAAAGI